jgi:hypothetical protein
MEIVSSTIGRVQDLKKTVERKFRYAPGNFEFIMSVLTHFIRQSQTNNFYFQTRNAERRAGQLTPLLPPRHEIKLGNSFPES